MSADVIDRIDELAAEERCPHCDREVHRLPLTRDVLRMFESGRFEANYFSIEDRSPIVCDGSGFIGPRRPDPPQYSVGGLTVGGTGYYLGALMEWPKLDLTAWLGDPVEHYGTVTYSFTIKPSWLIFHDVAALPVCDLPPDHLEVEFGPQNWLPPAEPVYTPPGVEGVVAAYLHEFLAVETHAPPVPPADFSVYEDIEPFYLEKKSKKGRNK